MNKDYIEQPKVDIQSNPKTKKAKPKFKINKTSLFIVLMLAYPLFHFFLMWFGVNINSILLTFQRVSENGSELVWVSIEDPFINYKNIIAEFKDPIMADMYKASFVYLILNCFITLPISLFFAYFIFKKVYAAGVFKTIFYLPSVLPIVALTTVYLTSFSANGFMSELLKVFGVDNITFFDNQHAKWMVWIFCFWTGIGYDVMLLTAAMSKIPRELLESAKMDGISPLKEFFHIVIPLSWPTLTTLFIFGMMGVTGTYLQPMLLVGNSPEKFTNTIGLIIFQEATNVTKNHPATIGLICTLIGTPIVLCTRAFLNSFFKEASV